MRRLLELIALLATFVALVATSPVRKPCPVDQVTLASEGTCGAAGVVVVSSTRDCAVDVAGAQDAGLPSSGSLWNSFDDAGVLGGFSVEQFDQDAGITTFCEAAPADGGVGLAVSCTFTCDRDAGCPATCTGLLTPVP